MVYFDLNVRHTVKEWKEYFLTIQPDLSHLPDMVANNIHSLAWYDYIKIKHKKGLVIFEHDFDKRMMDALGRQ